jgi:hypothetical protein
VRATAHILPLPLPPQRIADRGGSAPASHDASESGVRWSLVMHARARLENGYYDRENVRGWVADAVLREIQSS